MKPLLDATTTMSLPLASTVDAGDTCIPMHTYTHGRTREGEADGDSTLGCIGCTWYSVGVKTGVARL
jgi:hypothetical protein